VFGLRESELRALTGADPVNPTLALECREVFARGQRPIEVIGPVLEDEARTVHEGFWVRAPRTTGPNRGLFAPTKSR
jgi:hypothetical protein